MPTRLPRPEGVARVHFFFRNPSRWATWPYLPVVRRGPGGENDLGVLYGFAHTSGRTGYQATVFFCNLFLPPGAEDGLPALPREVFDTFEELSAVGWAID
jgi:hypothetical protein